MNKYEAGVPTTIGCLIFIAVAICFLIGSICWPYTINSWLEFAGKENYISWWQGGILGIIPVFGQLSIPIAVLTWILMLFLI